MRLDSVPAGAESFDFQKAKHMQEEILFSVGLDIGTTTTHLICSRIGITVTGGFGTVPQAEIAPKEIIYESPVYFTPLLENGQIDAAGIAALIRQEYQAAHITLDTVQSGAVIITGESDYTVVSNINRFGMPPVEAAAYIAELIPKMLREKASGLHFKL